MYTRLDLTRIIWKDKEIKRWTSKVLWNVDCIEKQAKSRQKKERYRCWESKKIVDKNG